MDRSNRRTNAPNDVQSMPPQRKILIRFGRFLPFPRKREGANSRPVIEFLPNRCAADAPAPGKEISLLVVVRTLREEALENFRRIAHRYARQGIPTPPLVTETFFRGSTHVFPLEYLGMAERRKVLAGTDVLADLAISAENLRHQIEFELKGKLLSLGRMYLATSRKREISRLILSTVGPIAAAPRGLLLALDPRAPHRKEEVLGGREERFEGRRR